jgi:hypothetical protein
MARDWNRIGDGQVEPLRDREALLDEELSRRWQEGYDQGVRDEVSGKARSRQDATRTDPSVTVRGSTEPREEAGIVGALAWIFRRPLAAVFLVLALIFVIAMLIWPWHVLEVLAVIGGLFIAYQVGRHARH